VSAKKKTAQHVYALKVSEILKKLGIPEAKQDKFGNPYINPEYLTRLPVTVKSDYQSKDCHRVIFKLYKQ
jgi:hypothetical protein